MSNRSVCRPTLHNNANAPPLSTPSILDWNASARDSSYTPPRRPSSSPPINARPMRHDLTIAHHTQTALGSGETGPQPCPKLPATDRSQDPSEGSQERDFVGRATRSSTQALTCGNVGRNHNEREQRDSNPTCSSIGDDPEHVS